MTLYCNKILVGLAINQAYTLDSFIFFQFQTNKSYNFHDSALLTVGIKTKYVQPLYRRPSRLACLSLALKASILASFERAKTSQTIATTSPRPAPIPISIIMLTFVQKLLVSVFKPVLIALAVPYGHPSTPKPIWPNCLNSNDSRLTSLGGGAVEVAAVAIPRRLVITKRRTSDIFQSFLYWYCVE